MSKRHQMTLSDYAVMAVCPALIVLLLSSLVYFLILCVYQGAYSGRIGYIWFMFILGAVNIARLSIEESRKYTLVYSAALGLATFFVLSRFQSISGPAAAFAPFVNAFLIGIVWLLADRITYDCTLIDDDDDASGQGLLDGLSRPRDETSAGPDRPAESPHNRSGEPNADTPAAARPAAVRSRKRRPPQPGRTVLWLTAAALPLFGFGQAALRSDPAAISSASRALAVYLFATLSLLVATSFLGVRRYLRQRGVAMPTDVSTAWLGGGIALVALILGVCFLLPQPGRLLAELKLPSSIESPDWLSPSRFGWGSETAKPSGQATGANPSQAPEDASTESDPSGTPAGQSATQTAGPSGSPSPSPSGQPNQSGQSGPSSQPGQSGPTGQAGAKSDPDQSGASGKSQPANPATPSDSAKSTQPSGQSSQAQAAKPSDDSSPSGSPNQAGPRNQPGQASQQGQQNQSQPAEPRTGDSESASPSQRSREPADSQPREPADGQTSEPQQTEQAGSESTAAERSRDAEPSADQAASESSAAAEAEPAAATPPESANPSLNLPSLSGLIKTLIYLVLLAIVAAFLWLNRDAIADFWRRLQAWLAGNPMPPAANAGEADLAAPPPTRRPFASFSNPLVAGADPRRAVIETFQAAEAWFGEHGQPRHRDETPHEYARRLKTASSGDRQAIEQVTAAYNRVVYGGERPSRQDLQQVQQLWQSVFRVG